MRSFRGCAAVALLCLALGMAAGAPMASGQTQEKEGVKGTVNVMGLEGVSRNAKGTLSVVDSSLRFVASKGRAEIPLSQVQDVYTGDDSQRVIRGTLQALSTFAPYGGGRFLSLFRTKVDLLTIEYRDAKGALHGVVLMLPQGKAAPVKKEMVARGAKTSVPIEEEPKKEEKKP